MVTPAVGMVESDGLFIKGYNNKKKCLTYMILIIKPSAEIVIKIATCVVCSFQTLSQDCSMFLVVSF